MPGHGSTDRHDMITRIRAYQGGCGFGQIIRNKRTGASQAGDSATGGPSGALTRDLLHETRFGNPGERTARRGAAFVPSLSTRVKGSGTERNAKPAITVFKLSRDQIFRGRGCTVWRYLRQLTFPLPAQILNQ